jgi:hypothetical protein
MRARAVVSRQCSSARAIIAAAALTVGANASAQIAANWSLASNGTWGDAANWSSNPSIPNGPSDTAYIGAQGGSYIVTLNSNITVASLYLDSPSAMLSHTSGTLDATSITLNPPLSGKSAPTLAERSTAPFILVTRCEPSRSTRAPRLLRPSRVARSSGVGDGA